VQISDTDIVRGESRPGPLQVRSDVLDRVYNGKVSYIAPEADLEQREPAATWCGSILESAGTALRSGMQVTVEYRPPA